MGNWNSGRRPHPNALKVLRGKKSTNPREPQPEPARPDFDAVPEELKDDPVAIKHWEETVPELRHCGIITKVERPVLIALCQLWSGYSEAHRNIRRFGILIKIKTNDVGPTVNPCIRIARAYLAQWMRHAQELGLTPSARSKLTALTPDAPQKISKWGNDL